MHVGGVYRTHDSRLAVPYVYRCVVCAIANLESVVRHEHTCTKDCRYRIGGDFFVTQVNRQRHPFRVFCNDFSYRMYFYICDSNVSGELGVVRTRFDAL